MELSVITDEISMDFDYALDVLMECGVKSAELRSLWNTNVGDLSDEQASKAKAALNSRGISVSCIASPFFKCDLSGSAKEATGKSHEAKKRTFDEQMELLERCIYLAHLFETKLIRVFSFWKHSELTDDIEKRIVEAFETPAARAQEAGVILALENEHACYLGTGEETARVLRMANLPALKAVWDPGNAFCAGEIPYPNGYEAIKEFIVHVHLKDPVRTPEGCKFVRIGDGEIDYVAQLQALKADGYQGYLSLETHYRPDGIAEKGSRECLESLKKLLANV